MIRIAETDKFFLRKSDNYPLIIRQGESINYDISMFEFNSLHELNEYVKTHFNIDEWEEIKLNYFATKTPDWDRFNAVIMSDLYFNNLYQKLMAEHPLIITSLPASVLQISQSQFNLFKSIYSLIYANAKANEIAKWARLAEDCCLPYPFQLIIQNPFA